MPRQFFRMVAVEALKVFSRGSGVGALIVAVLVGALSALAMYALMGMQEGVQLNGQGLGGLMQFDVVGVGAKALWARNFMVLPLLLFLATGASMAGEHADRTLRELVVRPVPRWSILAAKFTALSGLSAATLVATFGTALVLGWPLVGAPAIDQSVAEGAESLSRLALGYAASFVSDLCLIALGLALSTFVRSVGGVVVSLMLVLLADRAIWTGLNGIGMVQRLTEGAPAPWVDELLKWTLVGAQACWEGWESAFEPGQFVAVTVYTVLAALIAVLRFSRSDVP